MNTTMDTPKAAFAKKLVGAFFADDLQHRAAALTYYSVLSVFPALIVVVAVLGIIGLEPSTLEALLRSVGERTSSQWAVDLVATIMKSILAARAGTFLSLGIIITLWSASGYVGAFSWAANKIYGVEHPRPIWKSLPIQIGLALLLLLLAAGAVAAVTLIGPFGGRVLGFLGLGGQNQLLLSLATAVIVIAVALLILTLLFRFTPSRSMPRQRTLLVGALATLILWLLISLVFGFYLANFASYNRVYGVLGSGVALLVWTWLINLALLLGVEVNRLREPQAASDDGRILYEDDNRHDSRL